MEYTWFYEGEGTANTQMKMDNGQGSITVKLQVEGGLIEGKQEGNSETLPQGIGGVACKVVGVEWKDVAFAAVPYVRGVEVGASEKKVLAAYRNEDKGTTLYDYTAINPNAQADWIASWAYVGGQTIEKGGFYDYDTIKYGWCSLEKEDEWRQYYTLLYDMDNGQVHSIRLYVEEDGE